MPYRDRVPTCERCEEMENLKSKLNWKQIVKAVDWSLILFILFNGLIFIGAMYFVYKAATASDVPEYCYIRSEEKERIRLIGEIPWDVNETLIITDSLDKAFEMAEKLNCPIK